MWKSFSTRGVALCCLYVCHAAWADRVADNQQFIESLRDKSDALRQQAPPQGIPTFDANRPNVNQPWIDSLKRQQQRQLADQEKPQPKALYFVSFSIPEEGLKQTLPEAQRLGIPAVVNGLKNNDMRQTAETVFRLVREENNGGVQIDPTQFARFGITVVPSLVVVCGDKHDVIRGTLRIKAALEKVVDRGACADVAKTLLQEAKG